MVEILGKLILSSFYPTQNFKTPELLAFFYRQMHPSISQRNYIQKIVNHIGQACLF